VADDGLDERIWQWVCDLVAAAYHSDTVAFRLVGRSITKGLAHETTGAPGVYLLYLIQYRMAEILGHRPSEADIRELAERGQDRYLVLIKQKIRMADVLSTAWEMAPPDRTVAGVYFWIGGAVALAALLDDPPRPELAKMRPYLAEWYKTIT
jgi:hypothetical protein